MLVLKNLLSAFDLVDGAHGNYVTIVNVDDGREAQISVSPEEAEALQRLSLTVDPQPLRREPPIAPERQRKAAPRQSWVASRPASGPRQDPGLADELSEFGMNE